MVLVYQPAFGPIHHWQASGTGNPPSPKEKGTPNAEPTDQQKSEKKRAVDSQFN